MRTKTTSKILSETSDETKQKVRNNADNLITKIKEYQDTETAFLRGYKLAQERSYSEEDMLKSFIAGINFEQFWTEQFKKK